ncbi:hypothetical protein [Companilactobacillus furfuricola]|uniref:hypothetical protein n=1 Tax=Companilactobacillus furfuricola TaxID=1462575 RepID=UPI000F778B85|nr:hypothetical protein [Companilactobacillus furfuricola]
MKVLPVVFLFLAIVLLSLTKLLSNTFVPKELLVVLGIISLVLSLVSAVWGYWYLRKNKD